MDRYDVKKVMDQVHISSEMQEEIIMNIQKRMENENKNTARWNWRKLVTAAAAFVLAAGSQFSGAGICNKRGEGENGKHSQG